MTIHNCTVISNVQVQCKGFDHKRKTNFVMVQEQEGYLNSYLLWSSQISDEKKGVTTKPIMDTSLLRIRVEVYVASVTISDFLFISRTT